jgi:hypothetical protein
MLEKETERLLTIAREQTIGRGEAIMVKDILAAEIPYPLKVFFRADVERMLREEQRMSMGNSRFSYHHREVENLLRQMNSILVMNFTFLREEFLQKLEDGVHLTLNYLLRPQWTLTNFLFNTSPSLSNTDMKMMFAYFGAYEYLKEVFFRYLEDKRIESLRLPEFQNLVWRIDAEYIRRKGGMEIARLATPIFEFLHFTPFSGARVYAIPLHGKIITRFFEDKRFPILAKSIEQYCAQQNVDGLTLEQLQFVLDETCRTNPEALHPQEPTQEVVAAKKEETPAVSYASIDQQPQSVSPQPEETTDQPIASEQQQAMVSSNLRSLHENISRTDRKRFLKRIFKKDESYYRSSIDALNGITSWKEASQYIDKILIANDIDPYSSDAVRFSEVVYQRFFPKQSRP